MYSNIPYFKVNISSKSSIFIISFFCLKNITSVVESEYCLIKTALKMSEFSFKCIMNLSLWKQGRWNEMIPLNHLNTTWKCAHVVYNVEVLRQFEPKKSKKEVDKIDKDSWTTSSLHVWFSVPNCLVMLKVYIGYKKNQQMFRAKTLNYAKFSYVPKCFSTSNAYTAETHYQ